MRLGWPRKKRSSWDVFAHAGEIFPTSPLISPRRKVLAAEWVYLGLSWIAGAMWLAATPVFMVGEVEAGLGLFGYGLSLLLLSLIPLAWSLVKRRGRVAVPVRWTALGAVVLAVVPTVLAATLG